MITKFNLIELDKKNTQLTLCTQKPLKDYITREFTNHKLSTIDGYCKYSFDCYPNIAFVLLSLLKSFKQLSATEEALKVMKSKVQLATFPTISLYSTGEHVEINCPPINHYLNVISAVGAYDKGYNVYTVPIARAYDVIRAFDAKQSFLPGFKVTSELKEKILKNFDKVDSIYDLFNSEIDELYAVSRAYRAKIENFNNIGYKCLADFLLTRPRRYIDKTQITSFNELEPKENVTFIGKVVDKQLVIYKHAKFTVKVANTDFEITFWQRSWMMDKFSVGDEVLFTGEYQGRAKVNGHSMESLIEAQSLDIVPIYPQSAKNNITTKLILNSVYELLARLNHNKVKLASYIPKSEVVHISLSRALNELHFPSSSYKYLEALETLAFYELVYLQLMIADRKATEIKHKGIPKPYRPDGYHDAMKNALPWELTDAQKDGVIKLNEYMSSSSAEQVLLSADVGSGKTVLAQLACMQTLDNGYQAVLAGPTEVLARQLYDTFVKVINAMPEEKRPTIAFLSGSLKAAEKREMLKFIKNGAFQVVVGTHSVLGKSVQYKNLGLIVIDEQQKFGAAQRESLLDSREDGLRPDLLAQTATPIPRSTAQAFYGDIDMITLNGKPAGRTPVITEWIKYNPKEAVKTKDLPLWEDIRQEIDKGHQVFVVVPMVYENTKVDASSVEGTYKDIKKIFKDVNVSYLHGSLKKDEQSKVMTEFRNGNSKILIASTIIEVGVDVPNATRIIVLSADRMGASSLHQIRGRVGRSCFASKCYLVSEGKTATSKTRLQALVDSDDGFEIAKIDLKTRGEGDLFGLRQAGESALRFATLVDHSKLINEAQRIAKQIYTSEHKEIALRDARALIGNEEGV